MLCTVKKTLHQIVKQGNDYLVCVKANQQRLYRGIKQQSKTQQPLSQYQEHERAHGRSTHWTASVFDAISAFAQLRRNRSIWARVARNNPALWCNDRGIETASRLTSSSTTLVVSSRVPSSFIASFADIGALRTDCIGSRM